MIQLILLFILAVSDAFLQVITFKASRSIFPENRFDPFQTWTNKYKMVYPEDDNSDLVPKFPFSTTLLAWVTDPYHRGRTLFRICYFSIFIFFPLEIIFNSAVLTVAFYYAFERSIFHLFYTYLFMQKKERPKIEIKSIHVIALGFGIILLGSSTVYFDPNFHGWFDWDWNYTHVGFWVMIVGFTSFIGGSFFKLLTLLRKK